MASIVRTDRRPPSQRAAERRNGGRDDRDVPAGDRNHVAHAGRREICRELAVDSLPKADQDPGREPRFGFGQHARERRRRVPADGFQRRGRFDGSRFELEALARIVPATPVRSRYAPYDESGRGSSRPSTAIRCPGATTG